jgi:hypothetical protein
MTTNLAIALFALKSIAEQVTFVRPILKLLPERGMQRTTTGP